MQIPFYVHMCSACVYLQVYHNFDWFEKFDSKERYVKLKSSNESKISV